MTMKVEMPINREIEYGEITNLSTGHLIDYSTEGHMLVEP